MTLYEEIYFEITFSGVKSELKKMVKFLKSGELDDFFEITSDYICYADEYKDAGHGGGDYGLVRDFVEAVAFEDPGKLSSSIADSIESHVMGFAAEKSRKSNSKAVVKA